MHLFATNKSINLSKSIPKYSYVLESKYPWIAFLRVNLFQCTLRHGWKMWNEPHRMIFIVSSYFKMQAPYFPSLPKLGNEKDLENGASLALYFPILT